VAVKETSLALVRKWLNQSCYVIFLKNESRERERDVTFTIWKVVFSSNKNA
jgi:hypothetical protein